jgi:hypothetical protein
MFEDTIIAEIRQGRDEYAKKFNYDLKAMVEDIRSRQATSGHRVVSFPSRPVTIIKAAIAPATPAANQ